MLATVPSTAAAVSETTLQDSESPSLLSSSSTALLQSSSQTSLETIPESDQESCSDETRDHRDQLYNDVSDSRSSREQHREQTCQGTPPANLVLHRKQQSPCNPDALASPSVVVVSVTRKIEDMDDIERARLETDDFDHSQAHDCLHPKQSPSSSENLQSPIWVSDSCSSSSSSSSVRSLSPSLSSPPSSASPSLPPYATTAVSPEPQTPSPSTPTDFLDRGKQSMIIPRFDHAILDFQRAIQLMKQTPSFDRHTRSLHSDRTADTATPKAPFDAGILAEAYQYLGLAFFNTHKLPCACEAFLLSLRICLQHSLGTDTIERLIGASLDAMHVRTCTVQHIRKAITQSIIHEDKADKLLNNTQDGKTKPDTVTVNAAIVELCAALQSETSICASIRWQSSSTDSDTPDPSTANDSCHVACLPNGSTAEADIHLKIGLAYSTTGEYAHSLVEFRTAMRIYTACNVVCYEANIALCQDAIRASARRMGYSDNDIEAYMDALSASVVQETMADEICAQGNRCNIREAIRHYEHAIKLEKIGISGQLGLASLYTKISGLYEAIGDLQRTMSYHCHALAIYEPILGSSHGSTQVTKRKIMSLMQQVQRPSTIVPESSTTTTTASPWWWWS